MNIQDMSDAKLNEACAWIVGFTKLTKEEFERLPTWQQKGAIWKVPYTMLCLKIGRGVATLPDFLGDNKVHEALERWAKFESVYYGIWFTADSRFEAVMDVTKHHVTRRYSSISSHSPRALAQAVVKAFGETIRGKKADCKKRCKASKSAKKKFRKKPLRYIDTRTGKEYGGYSYIF